ncbi:MAG: polyamine aminopropyltransferase [Selenomonadaceae bacterium]|nr:polyamine aminopropyltransferase [Selenomonadaceae bacterium]
MDLWFTEHHTPNVRFSIKVEKQLFSEVSEIQRVDIFESAEFGRILVLDGQIMLTEKDEFIYHEMISHVPMCVNPNIKKVLLVGGGDGGTARELLKYETIEKIDLVEQDETIVRACKKFIPQTASCLDNPRVEIIFEDGLKFVRRCENKYDLIIVDSTDPYGPVEGLFTREFYGGCCNALREDGIMVNQHENPYYKKDAIAMQKAHKRILSSFPISRVYQVHIPTYPSGHWLFGFASKKFYPTNDVDFKKWENLNLQSKYYNTKVHRGAFYLPTYVEKLLLEVEKN